MPKLFLDANVLFAAAYSPDGRIAALFEFAELGACVLNTSPLAVEEARRNLQAKRPGGLQRLSELMRHVEVVPEAPPKLWGSLAGLLPPKDQPILAAAMFAGTDWLVTGDKQHFGGLYGKAVGPTEILSPTEALRRLAEAT